MTPATTLPTLSAPALRVLRALADRAGPDGWTEDADPNADVMEMRELDGARCIDVRLPPRNSDGGLLLGVTRIGRMVLAGAA